MSEYNCENCNIYGSDCAMVLDSLCHKSLIDYFKELKAQLAALAWIKITPETKPEIGRKVQTTDGKRIFDTKYIIGGDCHWYGITYQQQKFFTHWRYPPPLPDKEKSDGNSNTDNLHT